MLDEKTRDGVRGKMTDGDRQGYSFAEPKYFAKVIQKERKDEAGNILERIGQIKLEKRNETPLLFDKLSGIVILGITPSRVRWETGKVACKSVNGITSLNGIRCGSTPMCATCNQTQTMTMYDLKGQYIPDSDKTFYMTITKGSFKEITTYLNEKLDRTAPHYYLTEISGEERIASGYHYWGIALDPTAGLKDEELKQILEIRDEITTKISTVEEPEISESEETELKETF